jgi:hypothetical protein
MGSLLGKLVQFAKSPQGKKLAQEAEKVAENPKAQQEVKNVASKL